MSDFHPGYIGNGVELPRGAIKQDSKIARADALHARRW